MFKLIIVTVGAFTICFGLNCCSEIGMRLHAFGNELKKSADRMAMYNTNYNYQTNTQTAQSGSVVYVKPVVNSASQYSLPPVCNQTVGPVQSQQNNTSNISSYAPVKQNFAITGYSANSTGRSYATVGNHTTSRVCSYCGGDGIASSSYGGYVSCGACSGRGRFSETVTLTKGRFYTETICTSCNGTKRLGDRVCSECRGSGKVQKWH